MRQQNVDWGLLTNGQEYYIMNRVLREKEIEIQLVENFDIKESDREIEALRILKKESIEEGRSEDLAMEIQELRTARDAIINQKEELSNKLTEQITDEAGDIISQRAEEKNQTTPRYINR